MRGYKYSGTKEEILMEEKLNLGAIKSADQFLERLATLKQSRAADFEKITSKTIAGVFRLVGHRTFKGTTTGLGGTFTYSKMGAVLFGEYRDLGQTLPGYEELAKYIFYTETSRDYDRKALNPKTGKIGEYRKTSYYLLYTPNNKDDKALSVKWLKSIEKSEKNRNLVVYAKRFGFTATIWPRTKKKPAAKCDR
jgi:adenine-specific DNA-methyltransferase